MCMSALENSRISSKTYFAWYSSDVHWYLSTSSGGGTVTTMWLCQCHCEKVCELPNCIYWRQGKFLIDSLLPPRKDPLKMAENNFLVLLFKRENSRGTRFRWIDVGCSATSISENPEPWSFLRIPSIPATCPRQIFRTHLQPRIFSDSSYMSLENIWLQLCTLCTLCQTYKAETRPTLLKLFKWLL